MAAKGVQSSAAIPTNPEWSEKLKDYVDAIKHYETKIQRYESSEESKSMEERFTEPEIAENYLRYKVGKLRCLLLSGDYEKAYSFAGELWEPSASSLALTEDQQDEVGLLGARAALMLDEWSGFETFLTNMEVRASFKVEEDVLYYKAISAQQHGLYDEALMYINNSRKFLAPDVSSMLNDSYRRAYPCMISLQQLTELEEIVHFKKASNYKSDDQLKADRLLIKKKWDKRMEWVAQDPEVKQRILNTRALLFKPKVEPKPWLRLVSLFRKREMPTRSQTCMEMLGAHIPKNSKEAQGKSCIDISDSPVLVMYVAKHLAAKNIKLGFEVGMKLKSELIKIVEGEDSCFPKDAFGQDPNNTSAKKLLVKTIVKTSNWDLQQSEAKLSPKILENILTNLKIATEYGPKNYKAWHTWAYMNYRMSGILNNMDEPMSPDKKRNSVNISENIVYVVQAVRGFLKSIALGQNQPHAMILQDTLSLIGLWFSYGSYDQVTEKMSTCLHTIPLDIWLRVLPQLIARIHISEVKVQALLVTLLTNVGKVHPQALIYPLTVASRNVDEAPNLSGTNTQHSQHLSNPAKKILDEIRKQDSKLVEESLMLAEEIRYVAIMVHEMWHVAIEQASQSYFLEKNTTQMLDILQNVYDYWDKQCKQRKSSSTWTKSFQHAYGRDVQEAHLMIQRFKQFNMELDLLQAWRIYFHMYQRLSKQMQYLTSLRLEQLSPQLSEARNLNIAVPGTYREGNTCSEIVYISAIKPTITVILSKQRPRQISIEGSNGHEYCFLLKGREDLRQDKRVMQLFELINALLNHDQVCNSLLLHIQRYSVVPLSNNSGLIEWVPSCDTVHGLVKEYREYKDVKLNMEYRAQQNIAPDYDSLPGLAKQEIFEQVREQFDGEDLAHMLWLKSQSAEAWLNRRTTYTRSMAVMSITGYILGLGDRHPSNLMIHRNTGQVVHIDFGDCFEVCQEREKFPEIVPFRLTRMLVKAMGVSGTEGNFASTAEKVMKVLRGNRESLMAMLEAFIHDPLISWRLIAPAGEISKSFGAGGHFDSDGEDQNVFRFGSMGRKAATAVTNEMMGLPGTLHPFSLSDRKMNAAPSSDSIPFTNEHEKLDTKARKVTDRISAKLKGHDFQTDCCFTEKTQVKELIKKATDTANLSKLYSGWCPYW